MSTYNHNQRGATSAPPKPRRRPPQRPKPADHNAPPVNKSAFNGGQAQAKTEQRVANLPTREPTLRIVPMGGLGEVGKNMTAFEYGNDIIIVDMGFMFPTSEQPGIDYVIPDVTYLEKNKHKIRGHIITHGHEDHMGGIPYILPKLNAPMYGARFTIGMIEKKLVEHRLATQPQLRVIDPDKHERIQLGQFTVELVRVTHSIPDACAVAIDTPVGKVVHTGDFRIDPDPIDHKYADLKRFRELGEEGVLLLMSDSTACEVEGSSPSEQEIQPNFESIFQRQNGRVIVSSFSSQINRAQLVINAAHKTGRKLAFNGRSMLANVELAVKLGYLKVPAGLIMRIQDIVRLPDNQVVILCTGSQGEINSALSRMSTGDHPHIKIKSTDAILMSSSIIPGNEKAVVGSIDKLMREGSKVYHNVFRKLDDCGILHVSGHAHREELLEMLKLVRPKYFVPIHGEFHMQVHHAELIASTGSVPRSNIFVLDNGDVLEVTPKGMKKGERVHAGLIMIDGNGVGDVEGIVLRDRMSMSSDGIFVVIAMVDKKTGKLVTSPDVISRGFIYMKENEELIARARAVVRRSFDKRNPKEPTDWSKFKLRLRDDVSNYLYGETKRNPMVITVINEI